MKKLKNEKELVKKAIAEFGKVDILVNNAGVSRRALIVDMPEEDWRDVIDTNLTGTQSEPPARFVAADFLSLGGGVGKTDSTGPAAGGGPAGRRTSSRRGTAPLRCDSV